MARLRILNEFPKTNIPYWVKRLVAGEAIEVVILSTAFLRCMVHWDASWKPKGRTEPCTDPVSECHGHLRNLPVRGKGFLHVFNYTAKEQQFLELPPVATQSALIQLDNAKNLRGIRCRLTRGNGKKTQVAVDIHAPYDRVSDSPLPPELSPLIALAPLWRVKLSELLPLTQPDFDVLAS